MMKKIFTFLAGTWIGCACLALPLQANDWYDDGCCEPCCSNNLWVDADYLWWKVKNSPEPVPLVAEVDDGVVLGGKSIKNQWRSGGRFTLGYWFDDCHCYGADVRYFFLPTTSRKISVFSSGLTGSPALFVPYNNVATGEEDGFLISNPDPEDYPFNYSGDASLRLSNLMQGAELNVFSRMPCTGDFEVDLLLGFRYWNYIERLTFDTSSPFLYTPFQDVWQTRDRFHVKNNFFGGQVGINLAYSCDCFFANLKGLVALGGMCQHANVCGHFYTNDFTNFGAVQSFPGGYFALPTNMGSHNRTQFSVIPEVDFNLGYRFNDCFSLRVGYTFMYVTNVLYAGKVISSYLNPTQSAVLSVTPDPELVGDARPSLRFKSDNLWVQGVNAGIEFKF